jgi:hypothetical protein
LSFIRFKSQWQCGEASHHPTSVVLPGANNRNAKNSEKTQHWASIFGAESRERRNVVAHGTHLDRHIDLLMVILQAELLCLGPDGDEKNRMSMLPEEDAFVGAVGHASCDLHCLCHAAEVPTSS